MDVPFSLFFSSYHYMDKIWYFFSAEVLRGNRKEKRDRTSLLVFLTLSERNIHHSAAFVRSFHL
ncbi:hypothetical protein EBA29_03219 [Bacillus velezensis]|uniref:Uncharacterized protein n=1 Tax=Bacillus amyloliquefaciens (strain Y2) TaxID=1155777 RepID=I2CA24_BACAY|nr:hypothetical protein MUS_3629 [Bacillus velezensis YAU B9601-Y2]QAR58213.1 hypothetical protein EBA29_03219 [Bacillus velezensis]